MRVWLVRDLEPIPTDHGNPRLLRAGMLATTLASLGHETTWFTSSFNHYSRQHRETGVISPQENLMIEVLKAPGYSRNVGARRLVHNYRFARQFLEVARASKQLPNVIIADLPTTDAASAAVRFGLEAEIPTVLTIRDLWPDFFSDFMPRPLGTLARFASWPLNNQTKFACRHATSLIGISEGYLKWGQEKGNRKSIAYDRISYLGYLRPPPIALHEFTEALRILNIPLSGHVISFVGSWGATYDLSLVLQAARLLRDRKDITFALAGDPSTRPDLKRAFQKLPNVRLLGWIDKNQVAALLSRSDIGLLPYTSNAPQGLPNKIFEYMAYGAFQISTLSGEAKDLLQQTGTGLSIPSASSAEFAQAIETVVDDANILKKRDQRAAVFEARFDARRIYRELVDHIVRVGQK
ncbi:glycosyltransferase [Mesorhizobium sp. WSM2239]|uniref:Glycosyltransferase n=2 Tax=unclassified Mesorhizobium TaxID=325217 RepID=A0AAU8DGH1_9HYPH